MSNSTMITKEINVNVRLTEAEKYRIREFILKNRNKINACQHSDIHRNTFEKAMKKGLLTNQQRTKLLEYCDIVESKKAEA